MSSVLTFALCSSLLACDGGAGTTEPSGEASAAAEAPKAEAPREEPAPAEEVKTQDPPAKEQTPVKEETPVKEDVPVAPTGAPAASAEVAAAAGKPARGETGGEEAAAEAAEAPSQDADQPQEPIKVLMLGDSLARTGFGALVEKGLDAHPQVTCYRKGKSASGLARPDFFNWMDESRKQLDFRKPDIVVVIMGGNDGQDLTTKSGKGKRVHWNTYEWKVAYRKRMDDFLAQAGAGDRQVIWLGLPQMGMRSLEKKLVTIREIQKAAVLALGDKGVYVETTPFLVNEEGNLKEYGKVRGKKQKIRAEDRIHFTMSGSQFLADFVVPEILNQIGLAPVEG
jgi:hypothetical protein